MLVAETALCLMFQYVSEHDDVTFWNRPVFDVSVREWARWRHFLKPPCVWCFSTWVSTMTSLSETALCLMFQYVSEHAEVSGTEAVLRKLVVQFLPSITITVLNGALPIIFLKVVQGEQYTMEFVIKITLIRYSLSSHNQLLSVLPSPSKSLPLPTDFAMKSTLT